MRKPIDLTISYRLLNHGPLVLVTSLFNQRVGITPIAWHTPISDDPPIVALEIWEGHFIYKAILKTGDFVVNIPSSDMAGIVRKVGSVSGKDVDKFKKFNLEKESAKKVKSPRLKSAIALLECRLHRDSRLIKKYNIILGDVVWAEAEEKVFTNRWHPERKGPKTLHHLGEKIFCVPDRRII